MENLTFVGMTQDKHPVISGWDIFKLKDETGFPFSMAFATCEKEGMVIDWIGLIEAAREAGWWDFQTIEAIQEAFTDSQAYAGSRGEIMKRIMAYMMAHPHPGLATPA